MRCTQGIGPFLPNNSLLVFTMLWPFLLRRGATNTRGPPAIEWKIGQRCILPNLSKRREECRDLRSHLVMVAFDVSFSRKIYFLKCSLQPCFREISPNQFIEQSCSMFR